MLSFHFKTAGKYLLITKNIFIICCLAVLFSCNPQKSNIGNDDTVLYDSIPLYHNFQYGICVDTLDLEEYTIGRGDNLSTIFSKLDFSPSQSENLYKSVGVVLEPRKLQVGKQYITMKTQDTLQLIKYIIFEKDRTNFVVVDLNSDSILVNEYSKPITVKEFYAEGTIQSNLWNTMVGNNVNPIVALKLSDVFAWQIDFFDIKKDDKFKVLYEIAFVDDSTQIYIGDIKSAYFEHQKQDYYAIPFEQDSILEFFDKEGNSLKKAFLKAPLNFHRISSHFSNSRFHPVLKKYRAHHGVDYVAPTGTPVRSIGDGIVTAKAYQKNGGGYYLKIKHNSTYTTSYMHLSKYAKGIKEGSKVKQGEVIGYVGSTGLSTGAHLDFRVYKNGSAVNPLKLESPPSIPVKPENLDSFKLVVSRTLQELETKNIAVKD